jgi:hypothetical protein
VAFLIPRSVATRFLFWGFLKNVYKKQLAHKNELKQNTELCISNIIAGTLHWVPSDMRERVYASII